MKQCKHRTWLKLWHVGAESGVEVTDRLSVLSNDARELMREPQGLVVFVGNATKQRALKSLGATKGQLAAAGRGEINLFTSSGRGCSEKSFIIADVDASPSEKHLSSRGSPECHDSSIQRLSGLGAQPSPGEMMDVVIQKALAPLADCYCVFVKDLGGLEQSMKRVASWMVCSSSTATPAHPHLILIVDRLHGIKTEDALSELLRTEIGKREARKFQSLSLVRKSDRHRRRTRKSSEWDQLRDSISTHLHRSRTARRRSDLLFSFSHTLEFLRLGTLCNLPHRDAEFNLIKMSRMGFQVPRNLGTHIFNFFNLFKDSNHIRKAVPFFASSLIFDHYPPGMHRESPCPSFSSFY